MFDASLITARLLLAAVLLAVGVAELAGPAGSRKAVTDFGLPAALAGPLAVLQLAQGHTSGRITSQGTDQMLAERELTSHHSEDY